MIDVNRQRMKYVVGDFVMSATAWMVYTCVRYWLGGEMMRAQGHTALWHFLQSPNVMTGIIVCPMVMMVVYALSGYYNEVFRKSRLQELFDTIESAAVNSAIIFLVALINDMASDRKYNYEVIFILFALLFVFVYAMRAHITNGISRKIKNRILQFNTLIVGSGIDAYRLGNNLNTMTPSIGYNVVGYVKMEDETPVEQLRGKTCEMQQIESVCKSRNVKELIIAPTGFDTTAVLKTISQLYSLDLPIKITPSLSDIILHRARISQLEGDPLVDISGCSMSQRTRSVKRFVDIVVSLVAMILLLPVYAVLAIWIKLDSKGPVVYKQERLGLHRKPFNIYKFRSMVNDAEPDGKPCLSTDDDRRITRVGKVMRKYRLDETLQFLNVLRGDMSLVGPRPERAYFVDQIVERAPYYTTLHQVRPGITSLGMVKFGYASSVDEMIERSKYDLLYLDNMSLFNDLKIIIYTIKVVIKGTGI